ncbi:integrase core domain-containing protein [Leadbetterella byssophila]|uniref:integrase core domain-containing protein n=1 Tax=Leadbetterella byssophila TaxID=316068 RepID=UPI0039A2F40D
MTEKGVAISMDGKGRAVDNIFIERLWRSVKWEYVYLNPEIVGVALFKGLTQWFKFYNHERNHQGIDMEIPSERFNLVA